ncbi:ATP-dependent DNA helicase sgs1 [Puccinia graminis f. sp. tritici]|uniref:ATP-dependent DNA helicase sgs1 n=1 Tax=Puccinia graminis f. sp. tritici TaxID=56615 RepID=A0A5B0LNC7_PUCGR|nr:ATP-dependent DNA helicase sgs1 [Puccinia graminis f. sp. tritici]
MDGSSIAISVADPKDAHVEKTTLRPIRDTGGKKPLQLSQEILKIDNENLINHVEVESKKKYEEAPKKLQVATVCNLARGYHSFVLAGTGYGKSRIAELYFHLYAPQTKPVVIVLNPLDSLGKDQVSLVAPNSLTVNKITQKSDAV